MAGDVVDRHAVFENTQVCFGEEQKWYYLPDQEVDEILIFKNADGATGRCATAGEFIFSCFALKEKSEET